MTFNEAVAAIVTQLVELFAKRTSDKPLEIQPISIGNGLTVQAKIFPVQCKTFMDWELYADVRTADGSIERGWGYTSYPLGMYANLKPDEHGLKELLCWYFDHGKEVNRKRIWGCDERGFEYWETRVQYEDGFVNYVDFERGDYY